MSKFRVLLISSNSSGRGGGERYLVFLAKGFISQGVEVHVLLSDVEYMDGWANQFLTENVVVHREHLKGLIARPLRFLQAITDRKQIAQIAACCRNIAPNAILVNQQYDEDGLDYVMGALESGVGGIASIIHMPMTATKNMRPLGCLRGFLLRNWFKKHPYKKIFVSDGAMKEFNNYYKLEDKGYVVNNSIPIETSREQKRRDRIFSSNRIVIGFIGQFVAQKNIELIVSIWKAVRFKGIDARLLLVGDGPERRRIEESLSEFPPATWHITGWTSHPEDFLEEIGLFLLTSHYEGLPLSLVEAASKGIISVCAPFNGAADVEKYAPWVFVATDNNPISIANLVLHVLENIDDLKTKVTRPCLQNFKNHFSLSRMVNEVRDVLERHEGAH